MGGRRGDVLRPVGVEIQALTAGFFACDRGRANRLVEHRARSFGTKRPKTTGWLDHSGRLLIMEPETSSMARFQASGSLVSWMRE